MAAYDADAAALTELAPAMGSNLYYALLYVPARLRAPLTWLESFRHLISSIPLNVSNTELAATKLAWWHEEVARIASGTPRHALSRALLALTHEHPALVDALHALVLGVSESLQGTRYATRHERRDAFQSMHGDLWAWHAQLEAPCPDALLAAIKRLGATIELSQAFADLRRRISNRILLIARDSEPDIASSAGDATWFAALAAREIPQLIDEIAAAERQIVALAEGRQLRVLRVMSALSHAQLREIAADGFRVWEHRIELTPLRKLWTAWRVRIST